MLRKALRLVALTAPSATSLDSLLHRVFHAEDISVTFPL
ncbi:exported hypothetical protein [Cupriavidus taiwanensis]|nr:exported hypothetical protein [Cupriavidus taiwanensis]